MDTELTDSKTKLVNELAVLQAKYSQDELQLLGTMILMAEPEESEVVGHQMPGDMRAYDLAKLHQRDMYRDAEQYRLAKEAEGQKEPFFYRMRLSLGNFLVSTGQRLRGRAKKAGHSYGD